MLETVLTVFTLGYFGFLAGIWIFFAILLRNSKKIG
jgi:hypothetical protein